MSALHWLIQICVFTTFNVSQCVEMYVCSDKQLIFMHSTVYVCVCVNYTVSFSLLEGIISESDTNRVSAVSDDISTSVFSLITLFKQGASLGAV